MIGPFDEETFELRPQEDPFKLMALAVFGGAGDWEAVVGRCLEQVEGLPDLHHVSHCLDRRCHDVAGIDTMMAFDEGLQERDFLQVPRGEEAIRDPVNCAHACICPRMVLPCSAAPRGICCG